MILLAIAELARSRPGWYEICEETALLMDNKTAEGKPQLFSAFYWGPSDHAARKLAYG